MAMFRELLRRYRQTLSTDRRHLLEQYRFSQMARKVVGVGSVGTRVWVVLLEGPGPEDVLFLQAKEAEASVLERFTKKSPYGNHGARVVAGQRLMQASSDIFLGWQRSEGLDGSSHDYYVRQLQDWKGSIDTETMVPRAWRPTGACAPSAWPAPTPAPVTASPWRRTSGTATASKRPWPSSQSPTPTRTSGLRGVRRGLQERATPRRRGEVAAVARRRPPAHPSCGCAMLSDCTTRVLASAVSA